MFSATLRPTGSPVVGKPATQVVSYAAAALLGLMLPTALIINDIRPAYAVCLPVPGDIDNSGATTVSDVQCAILGALWSLNSTTQSIPACLAVVGPEAADADCSGGISVVDVQVLIQIALGSALDPSIDADGDYCPNDCEPPPPAILPGSVVITEIMVNPKLVADGVGEWIEIVNLTDEPLDLNGMVITDGVTDNHTINQPGGLVAAPGNPMVLGRNADPSANGGVNVDYVMSNIQLGNAGDTVTLMFDGKIVDSVTYDSGTLYPQGIGIAMSLDPKFFTAVDNDTPGLWCAAKTTYGLGDYGSPGTQNPSCFQCGNGKVEPGEECDNGAQNSDTVQNGCRTNCVKAYCGDAVCDSPENCGNCGNDCGDCGPQLCGGKRCRADQACVAGQCTFPCQGSQVPGDYATIQAAVSALSPVGGTICVKAGTYNENLTIAPALALNLIGVSQDVVTVAGSVTFNSNSGSGTIAMRGFTVLKGVFVTDTNAAHPIALVGMRLRNTTAGSNAHAVRVTRTYNAPIVTLDGNDIAGSATTVAVQVTDSSASSSYAAVTVNVHNNYLHDSLRGFEGILGGTNYSKSTLSLKANTFADNTSAVVVTASNKSMALSLFNNIITQNQNGIDINTDSNSTITHGNNLFFGNVTNFMNTAVPGAGTVYTDPQLDFAIIPPDPTLSSPVIGAGSVNQSPAVDYWAEPRDQTPDIGAVEFLCNTPPCVAVGKATCGDTICGGTETCQTCPGDCGACDPANCVNKCHADQACVSGTCTFACSGARVPGDYSTVQSAVTALSPIGGTICLAAGPYNESVTIAASKALTIIGPGADDTVIGGLITVNSGGGSGAIIIKGVEVQKGVVINDLSNNQPVLLQSLVIRNTTASSTAHAVKITRTYNATTVTIDGCDIAGTATTYGVSIVDSSASSSYPELDVKIRNCYFHDSLRAIDAQYGGTNWSKSLLQLRHNTLVDNNTGLVVTANNKAHNLQVYNTIFSEMGVGIEANIDANAVFGYGANAFSGNVTNYKGAAIPSGTDLYGELDLNWAKVPPEPTSSSVLIGKANASHTQPTDYWGKVRDSKPDVGCIEFGCANPPCVATSPKICGDAQCINGETCQTCPMDCGVCNPALCSPKCHVDQACVAGSCTFACSGSRVPGDYATIQAAVTALANVGGTICIEPGTYAESVTIAASKPLTLKGGDHTSVIVNGAVSINSNGSGGGVTLTGFTIQKGLSINDLPNSQPVQLQSLTIRNTTGNSTAHALKVSRTYNSTTVQIDGCDIAGSATTYGVSVVDSSASSSYPELAVKVRNSYIHDSARGIDASYGGTNWSKSVLLVQHTTLADNGVGLLVTSSSKAHNLQVYNTIFTENGAGIESNVDANATVAYGANAFYGNVTNFKAAAIPSGTDVFSNPELDWATSPPALKSSSPLIGKGLAAYALPTDYWGSPRDTKPDIGCVELLCATPPCVATSPKICGDNQCNNNETCQTCPADCGVCNPAGCASACRSDQACVAGICTFVCSGSTVPGDYATIQGAVSALQGVGGTICIQPGAYSESVTISPSKTLSLIGPSMSSATIGGSITVNSSGGTAVLTIRGISVQKGISVNDSNASAVIVEACNIRNTTANANAHAVTVQRTYNAPNVILDGNDIAGQASTYGVAVTDSSASSSYSAVQLSLRNNYIHDSKRAVDLVLGGTNWSKSTFSFINNTIVDSEMGLVAQATNKAMTLTYRNNVFTQNGTGISLNVDNNAAITHSHNAHFGNVVNFAGAAISAPSDITGDPYLDFAVTPPEPLEYSPLIGAGTKTNSPPEDYWAQNRDASPDIGAVEVMCDSPPCIPTGGPFCGDGICVFDETCLTCSQDCGICNPANCTEKCHAEQACVAGACVFPCSGAKVPGDYATVSAAVSALSNSGGTVCIAPGSYTESITVAPMAALSLVGSSAKSVILSNTVTVNNNGGTGAITFKGLKFAKGATVNDLSASHPLTFSSCTFVGVGGTNGHALRFNRTYNATTAVVDGCDVAGNATAHGVVIQDYSASSSYNPVSITVRNSYIHDSDRGLDFVESSSSFSKGNILLLSNTWVDNNTAIQLVASSYTLGLTYISNIVTENGLGVHLDPGTSATVTHTHNLFYGNATNYSGSAAAGANYVASNPLLNFAVTPPSLLPGSPAANSASTAQVPATDYWGKTRNAGSPDMGCVEQ